MIYSLSHLYFIYLNYQQLKVFCCSVFPLLGSYHPRKFNFHLSVVSILVCPLCTLAVDVLTWSLAVFTLTNMLNLRSNTPNSP